MVWKSKRMSRKSYLTPTEWPSGWVVAGPTISALNSPVQMKTSLFLRGGALARPEESWETVDTLL